jgi:hypothetical protein
MFIPESGNQDGTGARSDSDWDEFFAPFFQYISQENIKAFVHINWDWPTTSWGIDFADDCRLQSNDNNWLKYQDEIRKPRYITRDEGIFTSRDNHTPYATITLSDDAHLIDASDTMHWVGTASTDSDLDPLTCNWDFGDGQTAAGCDVNHVYPMSGTYFVRLDTLDGRGGIASALSFVTVGTPSSEDVRILATTSQPLPRPTLQVTVNGDTVDAPITVTAPVGSFISVDAPASQSNNVFRGWSTGGSKSKQILVVPASLRHTRLETAHFLYVP